MIYGLYLVYFIVWIPMFLAGYLWLSIPAGLLAWAAYAALVWRIEFGYWAFWR